jgi:DNA polymerase
MILSGRGPHPFTPQRDGIDLLTTIRAPKMPVERDKAARELLAFYQEAGVDALLGETPVDRMAEPAAAVSPSPAPRQPVQAAAADAARSDDVPLTPARPLLQQTTPPPPSPDVAVMAAREAAKSAASLEELRAILARFEGCALRNTATQLVFADGTPGARLMFVGEAPGRDEDIEGLPFVGRSGKLLDRMLAAIGLDRTAVYIANIVPWRPPGNRDPSPQESAICLPFIRRQIELCDPDILVCLGRPSMQTLLGINEPITKTRGRWFPFHTGTREIRAMPTLHPAYLLRQPLAKRLVWRDFLAIRKALSPS